jgi:hypothetical protein
MVITVGEMDGDVSVATYVKAYDRAVSTNALRGMGEAVFLRAQLSLVTTKGNDHVPQLKTKQAWIKVEFFCILTHLVA